MSKAQYIEMKIFLSNYLLSSQGDRMAMANSVEIRLPFLDYRLIDFMARVPSKWKILGLNEKYILKRSLSQVLPTTVCNRWKKLYRTPIVSGLFNADRVERLLKKVQAVPHPGEIDSMALADVLSSQIIHHQFVETFPAGSIPMVQPNVVVDKRTGGGKGISEMCRRRRQPTETEVVSER